ncbi:MAG: hypothetical protein ACLGI2_14150 [Acidimicrobiia bacterium]
MDLRRVALAGLTGLLLLSWAAFLLLPLLLPLHVWAARRSTRAGAVCWGAAAGLGAGMVAWAGVYGALGERQPFIWLLPLALAATVTALVARA